MSTNSMLSKTFVPVICLVACFFAGPLNADELDATSIEFFEAKVRPLLVSHCYECHSEEAAKAEKLMGGLRLDTRAGVHAGGDSGPVIESGKPDDSPLIQSVRYTNENLQMPPKERLSADEVAILEKWIVMGAPDPREGTASVKPGIDFEAARSRWAFQRPVKHAVPDVNDARWPAKPLDYFVLAGLEQRSLHPVRAATRQELIR